MDEENIYERIKDFFGYFPENLNIIEQQIDIDLQMEYFEFSRSLKEPVEPDNIPAIKNNLSDKNISPADKKKMLVQLASVEEVEAFRTIENYLKEPDPDLRNWALLAYQESRMLLKSKLLGENQVFISTGLGGKGSMLRYFVVLINNFDKSFDELQRRIVKNEFDFSLSKFGAELEEINFMNNYCSMLVVVSIKESIRSIFSATIAECNEYGGFLKTNFIVTNIRILNNEEINDIIQKQKESGNL